MLSEHSVLDTQLALHWFVLALNTMLVKPAGDAYNTRHGRRPESGARDRS
jgi:hypothetical protein